MQSPIIILNFDDVLYQIKEDLLLLFNEDIYYAVVIELAIDIWNMQYFCNSDSAETALVITNRLEKFINKEPNERDDIFTLIQMTIGRILDIVGELIIRVLPKDVEYIQFEKIDPNNDLFIKVVLQEDC